MYQWSLVSPETNQTRTATTGNDGGYKFSLLPPGNYRVRFSASGFKTAEVPSVAVNVTETPVLDRTLEVGAQSEQVTVEATAELLQTASSTLGTTVASNTVTALPLSSRNYTQILALSAGTNTGANNATAFGKGTQDMSVNGNDPGQNSFQMDGVNINNFANAGSANDSSLYAGIGVPSPGFDSGVQSPDFDLRRELRAKPGRERERSHQSPAPTNFMEPRSSSCATPFSMPTTFSTIAIPARGYTQRDLPEAGTESESVWRRVRRTDQ